MSNFEVIESRGKAPIKAWIKGVQLEDAAREQLLNVSSLPFVQGLAVMPDVHWGMGATVGSVIPTVGAIIPAAVGEDLGCGMSAAMTDLTASDLPDNLFGVRSAIEAAVPHGRTDNGGEMDRGAWGEAPAPLPTEMADGLNQIVQRMPKLERAAARAPHHMGTLGTGNHFIEICLDEEQRVWIMLHSGSRGIGNAIGSRYIELAKADMKRWFINLPDQDLAYIPQGSEHFGDYLKAVAWAQRFAAENRRAMMRATVGAVRAALGRDFSAEVKAVDCHHNYISQEKHRGKDMWVTRKGAVSAKLGQMGIIPGSMGAKSFIVCGKGCADSYHSCSHGAGRAMSRGAATKRFTLEDHAAATAGVECRKDAGVLDETPGAYKPIEAVMDAQSDLIEIKHTLRQLVCVKG